MEYSYKGKKIKLLKGILGDRVEAYVTVKDFQSSTEELKEIDPVMFDLRQRGKKTTLKTNVSKALNGGFNTGADLEEIKQYIEMVQERGIVENLDYSAIEYCSDIELNFNTMKENRFWIDVSNMFVETGFTTSVISIKSTQKVDRNSSITKDRIVGIKGYKNGRTLKIYSKLFEKGLCDDYPDKDVLRMELELNYKGITNLNIIDISDLTKIKREFKSYLKILKKESGNKTTRWNKKTHIIVEKFIENIR